MKDFLLSFFDHRSIDDLVDLNFNLVRWCAFTRKKLPFKLKTRPDTWKENTVPALETALKEAKYNHQDY